MIPKNKRTDGRLLAPNPMPMARLLFFLCLLTIPASAQPAPEPSLTEELYGTGAGMTILLTNSGFGIGGYFRYPTSPTWALVGEIGAGAVKDEREHRFFTTGYRTQIPSKANYFFTLPLHMGVQRRLFQEHIEDNFRPYVQMAAGPALGWVWPYFQDENGNGNREDDERIYDAFSSLTQGDARIGLSTNFSIGAFFGESRRTSQSIRLGYTLHYFFEPIALLQPRTGQSPQKAFGTPTFSLIFGRMW